MATRQCMRSVDHGQDASKAAAGICINHGPKGRTRVPCRPRRNAPLAGFDCGSCATACSLIGSWELWRKRCKVKSAFLIRRNRLAAIWLSLLLGAVGFACSGAIMHQSIRFLPVHAEH